MKTNCNVLIAGGRDYSNLEVGAAYVTHLLSNLLVNKRVTLIQGLARGADEVASLASTNLNINQLGFKAEWDKLGKRAGMVRNKTMVDISSYAIFFWDGVSKGTAHGIESVKARGIPYCIIYYENVNGVINETHTESKDGER